MHQYSPNLIRCRSWVLALCLSAISIGEQSWAQQPSSDPYGPVESNASSNGYKYDSEYSASRAYSNERSIGFRPSYSPDGKFRQPTSIVVMSDRQALITTKLTGEIYSFDPIARITQVIYEDSGASFANIVKLSNQCIAVADSRQDEVLILRHGDPSWKVVARLAANSPNDLVWDGDALTLYASGKWSRRLYGWRVQPAVSPSAASPSADWPHDEPDSQFSFYRWGEREQVDLPMCGGRCLFLPLHDSIVVVDAFGRDFVVVDATRFEVSQAGQLYGHNIAALAASQDEEFVFFPHQLLNEYARSVRNDITWGGLMSNNVRWLRTERLLHASGVEIFKQGKFYPLGTPGNGAGDPTSMAVSSTFRLAITLGGTNSVAVDQVDNYYFRQVAVGLRPVDCAFSLDESQLFVVSQFSDSVSVVDLSSFAVQHLPLGAVREPTQVELGEQAFFNSRLGHDGWMSCQSCHSEGHTNGQLNDNFSDKTYGTPKRILSLLGQAETMPYAWGGTMESLEDQVRHSIVSTMAGEEPREETVLAVAAYVRSLPEPPSLHQARASSTTTADSSHDALFRRGRSVFQRSGCADCHAGSRYTSSNTYDVGLEDESSMHLFNPPSLISVSQRQSALFHDARAKSLLDVLAIEKHQLPENLSDSDLQALINFLESL